MINTVHWVQKRGRGLNLKSNYIHRGFQLIVNITPLVRVIQKKNDTLFYSQELFSTKLKEYIPGTHGA